MKLKTRLIAAVIGAISLSFATSAGATQFFRLATLGPGSSPYLVMSTFAQIVNRRLPDVQIQVNATGTATRHAIEAAGGQLDFFMWSATVHAAMKKGDRMYAQIPQAPQLAKNLRAVFAFPLGLYHIVTYADSGIKSLEDIKGKTVFLGPPGGGATLIMEKTIQAATGLQSGRDYKQVRLGWDAAAQAFQDGRIDVYINPTNPPSPVVQQMALTRPIRLLGLTPEELNKSAVKKIIGRPGGSLGTIAPDTYGKNQVNEEPVHTMGATVGIGTSTHVAKKDVYKITKAFWQGLKASAKDTPWLRRISIDRAFRDLNLPLHPGAAQYYREIGKAIPARLAPPA